MLVAAMRSREGDQRGAVTLPDYMTRRRQVPASRPKGPAPAAWTGTQEGPFPQWGAPATGPRMSRESIIIWRVECGQLAEVSVVVDNLTMLRQLGIITGDELATAGTPTVATPEPSPS